MTRVFTATRAFYQLQYLLWHQFYTSSYRCCTEQAGSHSFGQSIWSGLGESDSRDFRQIAIWKCNLSLFYLKAWVVGGKEQREVAAALLLTSLRPCSLHVSVSVLYFDAIDSKHEFSSLSSKSERDASVNPIKSSRCLAVFSILSPVNFSISKQEATASQPVSVCKVLVYLCVHLLLIWCLKLLCQILEATSQ